MLVVLLSDGQARGVPSSVQSDVVERELLSVPSLSVGLFSTAQGTYTSTRMLGDIHRAAQLADTATSPERLRVLNLPAGSLGQARLAALIGRRAPKELVLVIEQASSASAHELRWSALAGLSGSRNTLSSQTTQQHGIVAALDMAPTLLEYLRLPIPASMHGKPIHLDGALDGATLGSLKARLEVVYPRRLPALACLLATWALLVAITRLAGAVARGRAGAEAAPRSERERTIPADARMGRAMRIGALAMLWTPIGVIAPAALEPSAGVEYALIVATCFSLAALSDRLISWPRAVIAPATAALLAIVLDALLGTQLLIRSLLGPNPAYGARFYGIGNELKSGLAVLVFAAVSAALYPATRSRKTAATVACAGSLLALIEGATRIGAGVGGVILVCAGTAVATVMLLPGPLRRRRILAVLVAPLVGLLLLAIVDLATAHGAGHFTGSVLDARSASDLQDLIVRRYEAAWQELGNGFMPLVTALALLLAAVGIYYRERLLKPVHSDPAWLATLAGGLTAGVVGALSEDSGPVLLVVAVFAMACVIAYLHGQAGTHDLESALGPDSQEQRLAPTAR
ncbi:MAG TPA: hypothetical protein VFR48_02720 [Solirubrobacteraceae bacterium]|nr:hypothetical protein [Solirubrobacteraceae bacterium]